MSKNYRNNFFFDAQRLYKYADKIITNSKDTATIILFVLGLV